MAETTNLSEKPIPEEPENIACSICLAEIPESVAVSSEADDYTQHFCGIDCYTIWRSEDNTDLSSPSSSDSSSKASLSAVVP
ncbi:MAG: DUF3330 domain-containing protein [Ectothiorhodospiraceae bacterium]|nr:DUF3330 domain-containing protein [Ectothiorhodospiraceae bacterium]